MPESRERTWRGRNRGFKKSGARNASITQALPRWERIVSNARVSPEEFISSKVSSLPRYLTRKPRKKCQWRNRRVGDNEFGTRRFSGYPISNRRSGAIEPGSLRLRAHFRALRRRIARPERRHGDDPGCERLPDGDRKRNPSICERRRVPGDGHNIARDAPSRNTN